MKTYRFQTAEPLYEGSMKVVAEGLGLAEAITAWFHAQALYRGAPGDYPSYGQLVLEGVEPTYAGEDVVYGRIFSRQGERSPYLWEVLLDIARSPAHLLPISGGSTEEVSRG